MQNFKSISFEFENKNYEIRVVSDGVTVYIRAFQNGKPANGYKYQVNLMTVFNFENIIEKDAIKELIEIAKNDIIQGKWEQLLKAIE